MHSEFKQLPELPTKPRDWLPVWATLLIIVIGGLAWNLEINPQTLIGGLDNMAQFASRFLSPDFSEIGLYLKLMGVTVVMACWGTAMAFVISFFLAPLGARNLSPHPRLYRTVREFFNFCRAMPDLLIALILVSAIGLGPLPGILSLGLSSSGFLGKFMAESLERVPHRRYEALASVGAGLVQTVAYAGWPSVLQEATGYTLFVLDRNVRMAAVLGLVGAGGIGSEVSTSLRLFQYDKASALIIIIIATILIIDFLSVWLRTKLK